MIGRVIRSLRSRGYQFDDSGALTFAEVVAILIIGGLIVVLGTPYIMNARHVAYQTTANDDLRSLSLEVESVLREMGMWNSGTVTITYNPTTHTLTVPTPGNDPKVVTRKLFLTDGTTLVLKGEGGVAPNTISGRHRYCLAVQNGGVQVFEDQSGPTDAC